MPIFEIKREGSLFHLYGDRMGERMTWLACSKFEQKMVDRCNYLRWLWSK